MEDTEPEEGKACCSIKDDDSAIDPDITLSYIGEKLQDVLGHFQKDFEGGVSAENLGAKFGGYGSFLPSYQRSPVWSHQKAPLKVHNYSSPRSSNSVHLESGCPNSLVASTASLSTRLGLTSANSVSLPFMRSLTSNDSVKHDLCMSSTCQTSIREHINNITRPSNKKLKLRIKVGSDNLLTKRNAEICSGLGLDVSPYSKSCDSHSDNEGLSFDPQAALDGSPTSILQIMTSFPIQEGLLISPLPDDLIYFTEKQKFRGESRCGAIHNGSQEYSVILVNKSDSTTGDHEVFGDKRPWSFEKNAFSVELKDVHDKNAQNHTDVLAKERDIDTSACEELVCNALKLPLLAISYCDVDDSRKGTARVVSMVANKSVMKGESFSDLAKGAHLRAALAQDIDQVEMPNSRTVLTGKTWEDSRTNHCDRGLVDPKKEGNTKGEKTVAFIKASSNVSNGREATNAEFLRPSKQKNHQKITSHEENFSGPGMNHCSISQEETTKAVIALYQVPASEGKSNQHIHPNGASSEVTPCGASHFDQNHENLVSHTLPCGRKSGLEVSDVANRDGSTKFPSSMVNLQMPVESRSLYGVNKSPRVNEFEVQHIVKSSSKVMESNKHDRKKNKLFECYSVEGDTKSSSTKSKRVTDQDFSGASKKIKMDDMHIIHEDWISDHDEGVMKVSPSSSWETKSNKYNSSKDSKCNTGNNLQVPIGNLKAQVRVATHEGSLHLGKFDDIDIAVKKREGYECQGTQIYAVCVEKTSDNDHSMRKKARVSKPEGKGKGARKGLDGMPEKVRSIKDQQLVPDLGCGLSIRHSMAATSSSSKLPGSHKNKDNLQEVKGLCVELISSPPRTLNLHFTDGGADTSGHGTQYPCKPQTSNRCHHEEKNINNQYSVNAFDQKKSGKACPSQPKEKNGSSKSDFDRVGIMISEAFNDKEMTVHTSYEENSGDGSSRFEEKSGLNSGKFEESYVGKKYSAEKPIESSGADKGFDGKGDSISSHDERLNLQMDHVDERSSKRFLSEKTVRGISRVEKAHSLPPSGRGQNERELHGLQLIPGSDKENKVNTLSSDEYVGDNPLKAPKQINKAENQGGNQPIHSRHPAPNNHKVRDLDAPISVRRDSSTQAAINAVKEAKDLKHLADRLKNSGSNLESTGFYFQAALKFLYGASKFESCNSESRRHSDMIQSMEIYSSTARLCEFCAREYEKCEDMAAAALAYKCMEVAYMRVIYSSHATTNRDRHELQMALQIIPPGESPLPASNVDNINNPAIVDKSVFTKGCSSPQIAGNYIIAARNHSSFVRLLNFAQNVNLAMEASRKSRIAFVAANSRLEEAQHSEGMTSIKRALDFNFQDVEELLQFVRLAMESITH